MVLKTYINNIILFICTSIICYILVLKFVPPIYGILISISISVFIYFFLLRKRMTQLNTIKLIFIAVFLLFLFIPFVGEKETQSLEKRALKEFPEWRWTNIWSFFKGYQNYFEDRFAYRNAIINIYGKIIYEELNLTPFNSVVVVGKDEWLFNSQKNYTHDISEPFTKEELQKFHYNFILTTKWFELRGIKYYLTILPVKARIYPEKMPDFLKIKLYNSRMEQLSTYLDKKSTINFIDCRKELFEGKKKRQLYYKTDTHWNQLGAFIGYSKIINTIAEDFEEVVPKKADDYFESQKLFYEGDLLGLLGYNSGIKAIRYYLEPKDSLSPILKHKTNQGNPQNGYEKWEMKTSENDLKIFMVRDSYSEHFKMFLSSNFHYSIYAWMTKLPVKIVVNEKPNIVLHEMLERFTSDYLELPPEIKNDTAFIHQFNIEDF